MTALEALLAASQAVPEESSPFGARPKQLFKPGAKSKIKPSALDEAFTSYGVPLIAAGKAIKEHPGQAAATLAGLLTLPETATGVLAASGIGLGAAALDKLHPFSDEPSEYRSKTAASNLEDLLGAAVLSGLAQKAFGKSAPARAEATAASELPTSSMATGFVAPTPADVLATRGFLPPKLIPAPPHLGLPEGTMVGNPARNRVPGTPEGDAFERFMAEAHPELQRNPETIYRGGRDDYDPNHLMSGEADRDFFTRMPGVKIYGSNDDIVARSYIPTRHSRLYEFINGSRSPMILDEKNSWWDPIKQMDVYRQAENAGNDAVVFKRSIDPGDMSAEAAVPSDVHVLFDRKNAKSSYNIGTWDRSIDDLYRLLPFAGLAAGVAATQATQSPKRKAQ